MESNNNELQVDSAFDFIKFGFLCPEYCLVDVEGVVEIYFLLQFGKRVEERTADIAFEDAIVLYQLLNVPTHKLTCFDDLMGFLRPLGHIQHLYDVLEEGTESPDWQHLHIVQLDDELKALK